MTAQEQREYARLREEKRRNDQRAAEAYRNSPAGIKEAEKASKRFASKLGIKTDQGQRILESGRSEFDPSFNSRNHGKEVFMTRDELGTLPRS